MRGEVARAIEATAASPVTAADYSLDPAIAYLNHGSVGTIPRLVQEAHRAYLETCERNPHHYMWGEPWKELREEVRAQLAALLGCAPTELAITHNTTEGFNVLAQGLPLGSGDEVLFSSLNHKGASICWRLQSQRRGFRVRQFDLPIERVPELSADEIVDLHLREIRPQTRVLVLPHIDNLVGLRTPVRRIAAGARQRGVEYIAVDGAQAVGMIPVDVADLGVDFYGASPHKWLQSPKGLGLFFVRADRLEQLQPMWATWGQEYWEGTARIFEDYGTRNMAAVLALGDAATFLVGTSWPERERRLRELWTHTRIQATEHSASEFASSAEWDLAASLYGVRVPGDPELVAQAFDAAGVVVRLFPEERGTRIRVSPNLLNTTHDIDRFFSALPA